MRRSFIYTLGFFLLFLVLAEASWQQEVKSIDKRIETLKDIKMGYESKVLYHESVGERLQFVDGELLSAKRHFKIADIYREKAKDVQNEIDQLHMQKEKLLQKHQRKSRY